MAEIYLCSLKRLAEKERKRFKPIDRVQAAYVGSLDNAIKCFEREYFSEYTGTDFKYSTQKKGSVQIVKVRAQRSRVLPKKDTAGHSQTKEQAQRQSAKPEQRVSRSLPIRS